MPIASKDVNQIEKLRDIGIDFSVVSRLRDSPKKRRFMLNKWLENRLISLGLMNAESCCDDYVPLFSGGVILNTALGNDATTGQLLTKEVTLTATEIVGTSAGDVGHAAGAIIVAAPGAGYALEFIAATLITDFGVAAYTGGADDAVFRQGTNAVSSVLTATNWAKAAADKIVRVGAIATEKTLTENSTINLAGTAYTQPGTAAGVVRIHVTYRIHQSGL